MPLLPPIVTNCRPFIANGNFKSGETLWAANGAGTIELVQDVERFKYGSIHVVPANADQAGIVHDFEDISPSTRYLMEVYLRGSGSWQVMPATYTAADSFLATNSGGELVLNNDDWQVVGHSFVSGSTAAKMRLHVVLWGAQAGVECWVGAALRRTG